MKGPALFQGEIITKLRKYVDEIFKSYFPEPLGQFQPKIGTTHSWKKGIQVYTNEGPLPFPRGDNYDKVKIY